MDKEQLEELHSKISNEVYFEMNDEVTRNKVLMIAKEFCDDDKLFFKCDEENNGPHVMGDGCLILLINEKTATSVVKTYRLGFGNEANLVKYL